MKFLFLVFMLLVTSSIVTTAQNIWTVNNQPSFSADFTSLQVALDSADAGDILMVHGSSTSYGNISIRKRIVIIGTGYFLGQNNAPNTQANPQESSVGNMTFFSNSSGTFNASGSLVTGMRVTGTLNGSVSSLTPIDYTVQRCFINYIDINSYIAATIKECFIHYPSNNGFPAIQLDGINTITFENNIIWRSGGGNAIITTNTQNSGIFKNNIIVAEGDDATYTLEGDGLSFTNNLFLGDQDIEVSGNFGQVLNNMSNGSTFDGIATNITEVDATSLVIGWSNPEGFAPDNRFTTKQSAASIGAGVGGENIGAFTNSSPYILSGIPFVPNIYALDAPDFGTTGSGITIDIKAKANN